MTHFAGKAAKVLLLSAITTLLLAVSALAAEGDIAVNVGATTGSNLRLRTEASTSSEIITTLNKGIAVSVLDTVTEGWYKIAFNGKVGFVSADYMIIDQDNLFEATGRVNTDSVNVRTDATTESEIAATLDADTYLTVTGLKDGWYAVTCKYGTQGYVRSDFVDLTYKNSGASSAIVDIAKQLMGTPYVWGGTSTRGFDCSGFTLYLYKQLGYNLPHTASGQWKSGIGTQVSSINELQPGDLVFFNDPSRNAGKACSHVGMYIGNGQHIHASSSRNAGVIISDLTSGYYNRYFIGGIHV
jgi:cell wall-associated NlpC family hydrolase